MKRVLGLDLGTNSIGWAVVDVPDNDDEAGVVIALGSRIFPEGAERDGYALVTKTKERRQKRSMRRQVFRRAQRKRTIRRELAAVGLLPVSDAEFADLMTLDPATLIERSNDGKALSLREIGRVVYWFSVRRGFLSLRSGGGDFLSADDEDTNPKRYRRQMVDPETGEIVDPGQEGRFIDCLLQQQHHHAAFLTDAVIFGARGRLTYPVRPIAKEHFKAPTGTMVGEFGLHGLVFFQRKVTWSEGSIGMCSLDPRSGSRAPAGDRLAQRYRVWKMVIDLRVDEEQRPLTPAEREALVELLMKQKSASFSRVRKVLGLDPEAPINFERPGKTDLTGNGTDTEMRRVLGDTWDERSDDSRDAVVHLLLGNASDEQVRSVLATHFGLDSGQVAAAAKAKFPAGRAAYSRRTLRRLLAVIGDCETEREAIEKAGYGTPEAARQTRTVDLAKDVTNPLVKTTLQQLKKTTAALARTYGLPGEKPFDVVRIELTRDVRQNAKQRERTSLEQRENERRRQQAQKLIGEYRPGAENSRELLRAVELWKRQNEQCLYCGKPISPSALFSAGFEMDHVLPRSRTLDDSLTNLALVCSAENQEKGNRTITEWRGAEFAAEVAERAKMLKLARRLITNVAEPHVPDDAIPSALLVQTGHINAVARDFVRQQLGVTPQVSAGRVTAQLRYRMGLHKDANDHRRHGLDAAAIALCDVRIARKLASDYRDERDYSKARTEAHASWEPWPGARNEFKAAYEQAVVSHVVRAKTSGAWFEDTRYGLVTNPSQPKTTLAARRRNVTDINNPKKLSEVADPMVRQALEADLRRRNIEPTAPKLVFRENDLPRMPDGQVIKRVRCHISLPGNVPAGARAGEATTVTPAGNHSAWIYKNQKTGRWRVHVISLYDAFCDRGKPLGERRKAYAKADEIFQFSVSIGSTFELGADVQTRAIHRVVALDRSDGRVIAVAVESSGQSRDAARLRASSLAAGHASKVVVLSDGRARTARD